jgi:hypothetical protein
VSKLKIGRIGSRDEFHFDLTGVVDPAGARALDRLLLECQARAAKEVRLEFERVESICALGLSVLSRWGRVYDETDRRILVSGLSPVLRAPLVDAEVVFYEENRAAAGSIAVAAAAEASVPAVEAPVPAVEASVPAVEAPVTPASPAVEAPSPPVPPAAEAPAPAAPPPAVPPAPPEGVDAVGDELTRLQTRLRRRVLSFRNLFEVTQALNLARDLDEVQNLFGLHLMGQFGLRGVALFLTDAGHEETVSPRHVRGFATEHFRDFTLPTATLRSVPPEHPFFSLSELLQVGGATDGLEALLQSGFEWGVALWVRRDLVGVLFLGERAGDRPFGDEERELLQILSNQAAVAIVNARIQRALEERNLGLVRGMMALIESRDVYAKGSTERVVRFVTAVAKLLNYPKPQLKALIYGSVLRDIGMITVSQLILKNPAHLSEEEWATIREHPTRGAQILEEMDFPRDVIGVVQNHHERWCGEGYPKGIRGTEIPMGARIVALVDAYVAMTAERPYRRALPHEKARRVIAENWGTPFDPGVVDAFLAVLDRVEKRSRQRLARAAGATVARGASDPAGPAPSGVAATDATDTTDTTDKTDTTDSAGDEVLDPLGGGATIPRR